MPDHNTPAPATATLPRQGRRRWPWLLAAASLLAVALFWYLAPHRAPPPAQPPAAQAPAVLTVALARVEQRALARPVVGDGSVVAWRELVIGAEAGGLRVETVAVEEGDSVRRGDLLVALGDAVPAAQAAQAEAAVAEAEAALRVAEADLRRATDLARSENVARQTLEQRQATARQAEARLLSARARAREAEARLAQTRILAPADGVVSRRSILPGAVVQPGQEMARLIEEGRLELEARVPELDLAAVAPGQAVRVLHGGREIQGSVRAVAPVVAGETRLGLVHVALPAGSGLRPGMFARAEILPEPRPALMVPQEAVVFRGAQAVVFVLPEGADRVAQRPVGTGSRQEGMVVVTEGLAAGERIVVTGAGFLSDGDRVRTLAPR